MLPSDLRPRILQSVYVNRSVSGENFIPEHIFGFQVSGSLKVYDGCIEKTFKEGVFRLGIRNSLSKYEKIPSSSGEYRSLSIAFDQETLLRIANKHNLFKTEPATKTIPVIELQNNELLQGFVKSLDPYFPFSPDKNDSFVQLKLEEAVLIILKTHPQLKNVLFDFSEPGKIDLHSFMEHNYRFNLKIPRFAYLTGRSTSTFKRDFEKIYKMAPSRWILNRRLNDAYDLIKRGAKPSKVFLEVGFEDLSHFSYVFKKQFGMPPSELK